MEKSYVLVRVRGVTWQEIEREISGRFNHIRRYTASLCYAVTCSAHEAVTYSTMANGWSCDTILSGSWLAFFLRYVNQDHVIS